MENIIQQNWNFYIDKEATNEYYQRIKRFLNQVWN